MLDEKRSNLMGVMWFVTAIVLASLFVSAGIGEGLTILHLLTTALILLVTTLGTFAVFRMKTDDNQVAKSKRQRIDDMLRDMSDEDLFELKQRLSDGSYDEEQILDYLADDGELVMRR